LSLPVRFRSLPIFWQTLILLLTGLAIAQVISILLIIYLPAPRPDFYTMTEIAERLTLEPGSERELTLRQVASAPDDNDGRMTSDPALTRRLAFAVDRPVRDVRLFFEADQSEKFPFTRQAGRGGVPFRHGQPYFFNTVVAAMRDPRGAGWRVIETPPPARVTAWQQRTTIWFGVSALAMLPVAWALRGRSAVSPKRSSGSIMIGTRRRCPPRGRPNCN
jgi:two-component system, OmpR family, sensor kinase